MILEAVNLATATARHDADALVSRLLRIRAASTGSPVTFMVGYIASPGGLNGEAHMCDWIRQQVTQEVYDLQRDADSLRKRAAEHLAELDVVQHD